ncbi:hypothetical protein EMIHUDRAFT_243949 [Emiliania huxleyi CCMP1516]|uniref:Polymerase nucleotidyl transferase domain-containing protein n=2 Tax=Emiliania huxleyi TaxID=2903 RepID=A0A0D3J264_EMIH1|nr:hypothetical protein EMIHUDRAFT_243949 [Emiliania huxleyi CCMP1516]EOD17599.1 hypothetical protein EMIHUDRAFT_243949 [Emiliania huxleyi CCMP1516]|eukprot:XP_005770028.1 hypothetical protein EMIHUDRAFT_243949 [Emiliania huxleyi CCMP1516]
MQFEKIRVFHGRDCACLVEIAATSTPNLCRESFGKIDISTTSSVDLELTAQEKHGERSFVPPSITSFSSAICHYRRGFELLEYGARKKGTDTEWSDIDVVVVGSSEERETLQRFRNLVFNKEAELLQQLGIRQVIINDEKLTARVPTLKFSLTTNLHAALHVCVLPALAASIDLRSFHIEVLVLCFLLDSRVWPRKAYSGENARAQLLLDLVEFYATRFRPREHYIHHERGTTKMYFVQRQEGRMGDLVMSSLLPASDAEGDAFYDSPRDGGWEQVIKPFFQTISDGIRNQSWSPELEELLGVGRPTRSERFRNRLGGKG